MMNKILILLLFVCPVLLGSCGHSTNEVAKIIAERDSLRITAERQQRRMSTLDNMLSVINSSIDSITREEVLIFTDPSGEGTASRKDALRNVENLAAIISNQKRRIADLEERLREAEELDGPDQNVQQMLDRFKTQIYEKDREIAQLKEQLEQKNVDIALLQSKLGSMSQTIAELDKRNVMQSEALKRQDAMLNNCYVRIADKKTLGQLGIVKKGKILPQGALDRSKFSKVDIRAFTEVEFDAKRPRILTSMPDNSYDLITDGKNHYILKITNPTEFWRISNYLIIQTD